MAAASEKVGGTRRFFDISVPRNIAPDIGADVSGRVYNVDDLKEVVSKNKEERRKAADEAQALLAQEQLTFEAWRDSLETVPTIKVIICSICLLSCSAWYALMGLQVQGLRHAALWHSMLFKPFTCVWKKRCKPPKYQLGTRELSLLS